MGHRSVAFGQDKPLDRFGKDKLSNANLPIIAVFAMVAVANGSLALELALVALRGSW